MKPLKLSYKPLKVTLILKDKTNLDLKQDLSLAPGTMAKLNKDEYVALSVIHKICEYLDCPIQEVVEFVEDDPKES
ncbi:MULTISPECIES: helix-turn-helix domain-containing protein [Bacillus]|uniref:helix-turn-helix domain-containing protein n=1 Tax=Bacillus TaxID=1386 RepID=UPI0002B6E210|nr:MULTISPECIES: helix-turn-helix domain-containing protein [Bacillus]AMR49892.1 XRE family transcriptional regulator [Bacillus amyloliquefaciens]KMO08003.1 XRE family transcriptional regulator [Bacillus amyloliquefaciens]MBE7957957.1 helix-turn-helix domain-containing protein [Bacillus amyloliquefaciens]MCB7143252.1 helix-turn-helix domain-containing protein [Bacillus velezensis]MCC2552150.1 helix-turn-helix domain-containing protein [Bacillus velezensis]